MGSAVRLLPFSPRRLRAALALAAALSLLLAGVLAWRYVEQRRVAEAAAYDSARQQAAAAAAQTDAVFLELAQIAQRLADDLSSGALPYTAIDARMIDALRQRPDISGLAVTFEPYVYDPAQRLYQAYHFRDAAGALGEIIGATYDYTVLPSDAPDAPQTGWYHGPLASGAMWNEPFFATGAQQVLIEYGVPFQRRDMPGVAAGVVTIDYSLQGMQALIAQLRLGATSYGYVISGSGTYLAHPLDERVAQQSVYESEEVQSDPALQAAVRRAQAGERVTMETTDPVSGQNTLQFFEPLPATGWTLGIALDRAELAPPPQATLRELSAVALALGAAAVFGLALALRIERGSSRALWALAVSYSLLCVLLIAALLAIRLTTRDDPGVAVTDQSAVSRYVDGYRASLPAGAPLYETPVGLLLTAVEFPTSTTAMINGYVWQRLPPDLPEELLPGVVFPQLTGNQLVLEEADRATTADGGVLVVWSFGVEVRQSFDPGGFPFDQRALAVRLAPAELQLPVMLVPDLGDFTAINPRERPGLADDLRINNWGVLSAKFSYQQPGIHGLEIPELAGLNNRPELYYTVRLQRSFVGPVIAYLLPGLVAAGMMFAFISGDPKVGDQEEIISTLSFTAALFFVITVAHTALRDSIAAVGITYLENLYLLLYGIIILATLNAFLLVRAQIAVLEFRNNLLSKLLYWPLISTVMLLATLATFVYA